MNKDSRTFSIRIHTKRIYLDNYNIMAIDSVTDTIIIYFLLQNIIANEN